MPTEYQKNRRQRLRQEGRLAWLSVEVSPATSQRLRALSKALGRPQRHILEQLIQGAHHGL